MLGLLFAAILWFFSVPPDIRRARVCLDDQSTADLQDTLFACVRVNELAEMIADHYQTCGRDDHAPCVSFDFSIDPTSSTIFADVVDSLSRALPHM